MRSEEPPAYFGGKEKTRYTLEKGEAQMKRRLYYSNHEKMFNRSMLLLCAAGLALNILLPKAVALLGLSLYMDSTGSLLVAILGGVLPGMFIGFLTNLIQSVSNPYSMYYGILSILIAMTGYEFSRRGWLKRLGGFLALALTLALMTGFGGGLITHFLYDAGAGDKVASPLTLWLMDRGISSSGLYDLYRGGHPTALPGKSADTDH